MFVVLVHHDTVLLTLLQSQMENVANVIVAGATSSEGIIWLSEQKEKLAETMKFHIEYC